MLAMYKQAALACGENNSARRPPAKQTKNDDARHHFFKNSFGSQIQWLFG
jgi:hypothetical protein